MLSLGGRLRGREVCGRECGSGELNGTACLLDGSAASLRSVLESLLPEDKGDSRGVDLCS